MKRNKLKVQKVVGILTDPHPEFVSLVNFPANQTPFTSVKFDKLAAAEGEDAAALAQRAASAVVSIQSVTFSKKQFKSEAAVTAYMDENGYANYAVEDKGDYYFVPGEQAEDEPDSVGEIEVSKGVIMSVARHRSVRKSAATPPVQAAETPAPEAVQSDEEKEAATKAAPVRSFKSLYSVSYMADVLMSAAYILSDLKYEAEYDGDDADNAVVTKFKTWLGDGARLFETLATDEVATLIEWASKAKAAREAELTEATKATTVDPKTTPVAAPGTAPAAVKPAATSTVETPADPNNPAPAGETPPVVEAGKPDGEPPAGTDTGSTEGNVEGTEPVVEAPAPDASATEATKSAPPAMDANALAEAIGKSVAAAVAPLTAQVSALAETVSKSEVRLSDIEGRRQVRRSGGHEDTDHTPAPTGDAAKAQKDAAWARRSARDALGF